MKYDIYTPLDKPFKIYTLFDFNFIKWLKYGTAARRGLYLAYRLVYQKNTSIKFLYELTQTIDFFSLNMVNNLCHFKRNEGRFYLNHTQSKSFYLFKTFSNKLFYKNLAKLIFNNSNLTDKLYFNILNNFSVRFYIIMLNFFFFHLVYRNNFICLNLSFFMRFFSSYYKFTRDVVKYNVYNNFFRLGLAYQVNLFLFRFETTFLINFNFRYEFLNLLEKNPLFSLFFKEKKFESKNYVRHFIRFKYRRRFFRIFFILALKKVRWRLGKINNKYYKNVDLLALAYKKYKLNILFKKLFFLRLRRKKGKRKRSLKFILFNIKRRKHLILKKKIGGYFFFFRKKKFYKRCFFTKIWRIKQKKSFKKRKRLVKIRKFISFLKLILKKKVKNKKKKYVKKRQFLKLYCVKFLKVLLKKKILRFFFKLKKKVKIKLKKKVKIKKKKKLKFLKSKKKFVYKFIKRPQSLARCLRYRLPRRKGGRRRKNYKMLRSKNICYRYLRRRFFIKKKIKSIMYSKLVLPLLKLKKNKKLASRGQRKYVFFLKLNVKRRLKKKKKNFRYKVRGLFWDVQKRLFAFFFSQNRFILHLNSLYKKPKKKFSVLKKKISFLKKEKFFFYMRDLFVFYDKKYFNKFKRSNLSFFSYNFYKIKKKQKFFCIFNKFKCLNKTRKKLTYLFKRKRQVLYKLLNSRGFGACASLPVLFRSNLFFIKKNFSKITKVSFLLLLKRLQKKYSKNFKINNKKFKDLGFSVLKKLMQLILYNFFNKKSFFYKFNKNFLFFYSFIYLKNFLVFFKYKFYKLYLNKTYNKNFNKFLKYKQLSLFKFIIY